MAFIIFGWIILSVLVGIAGSSRSIGFFLSFLLSLIFSPLIGVIGVALSSRSMRPEIAMTPYETDESERDKYYALKRKKDMGLITEAEFIDQREDLFNSSH